MAAICLAKRRLAAAASGGSGLADGADRANSAQPANVALDAGPAAKRGKAAIRLPPSLAKLLPTSAVGASSAELSAYEQRMEFSAI